MRNVLFAIIGLGVAAGIFFLLQGDRFEIPRGESVPLEHSDSFDIPAGTPSTLQEPSLQELHGEEDTSVLSKSNRQIFATGGVKHSIPTEEILSGGPAKDGIPSIDSPKFISAQAADSFLAPESVGLGFVWKGEARFYPYSILVWHEIVNDTVQGDPILVTYCPLCATGVVFERKVNGQAQEFGTSGMLWQSNLLMYNRDSDAEKESLWSQVLGEAVLGEHTGTKLKVLAADTVRYGAWKEAYPATKVLSQDTGAFRDYGRDPYGNYYTDTSVGFGASFQDTRLHPKEFVLGIEIQGKFKAYQKSALAVGVTNDTFAGAELRITKDETDQVRITDTSGNEIPIIGGFWFSWLAVHPDTELYTR